MCSLSNPTTVKSLFYANDKFLSKIMTSLMLLSDDFRGRISIKLRTIIHYSTDKQERLACVLGITLKNGFSFPDNL